MDEQFVSLFLFGKYYDLPVIKDSQFTELQAKIQTHREVLATEEKKGGFFSFFVKKEELSPEERLERMELLVENYDELIQLLRSKIHSCRQVFEAIGDGVQEDFLQRLANLEQLEQDRQRIQAQFIQAGHADSTLAFEQKADEIRTMVTNLSRAAILIIKKLRHALDALETLAADDEKQLEVYQKLKNDVGLYRQYYEFNRKMAAVQKEIAELTNIALSFDSILRDNLGPLGTLVDQISQIDVRLGESLAEIEKLSAELERGNLLSPSLEPVSDKLMSTILTGRMRADIVSEILEQMRNPSGDLDQIDFSLSLTEAASKELDFAALAENMRVLVRAGIHDLDRVGLPQPQAAASIAAAAESIAQDNTENLSQPQLNSPQMMDKPSAARIEEAPHKPIRKSYTAPISRSHPTLIVFMLDQSGSMANDYNVSESRSEYLAHVVDQLLEELAARCNRADGIRDYFHIALIGYGNEKIRNLVDQRSSTEWVPISKLVEQPLSISKDREGVPHPHWVPVISEGDTPMQAAFERVCHIVAHWCDQYPESYPPTVINITDGDSTDGDPEGPARILRQIHTRDGETLLFNLHVDDRQKESRPIIFPVSPKGLNEYGSLLFRISSPMPEHLLEAAAQDGFSVTPASRFFAYGAGADLATRFLNLGTRPGKLL